MGSWEGQDKIEDSGCHTQPFKPTDNCYLQSYGGALSKSRG